MERIRIRTTLTSWMIFPVPSFYTLHYCCYTKCRQKYWKDSFFGAPSVASLLWGHSQYKPMRKPVLRAPASRDIITLFGHYVNLASKAWHSSWGLCFPQAKCFLAIASYLHKYTSINFPREDWLESVLLNLFTCDSLIICKNPSAC